MEKKNRFKFYPVFRGMSNEQCFIDIVYIVDIVILNYVDLMLCKHCLSRLTNIESISCQYYIYIVCLKPCLHHWHRNVVRYQINIVSTSLTSFTLSSSQCCMMLNQYRGDNFFIKCSSLLLWHCSVASFEIEDNFFSLYIFSITAC